MSLSVIIILITCLVSFQGFSKPEITNKLIFYPTVIKKNNEWYRFITCGFLHADVPHLIFNMLALYSFGEATESMFAQIFGPSGKIVYLLMYLSALVACLVPTYFSQLNNYYYRSLGASGAVSAVVFCYIVLQPHSRLGIMFIPIPLPAYIFGAIYLAVSVYLSKKSAGNINHSAHFWGAVYGIVYLWLISTLNTDFNLIEYFLNEIR